MSYRIISYRWFRIVVEFVRLPFLLFSAHIQNNLSITHAPTNTQSPSIPLILKAFHALFMANFHILYNIFPVTFMSSPQLSASSPPTFKLSSLPAAFSLQYPHTNC